MYYRLVQLGLRDRLYRKPGTSARISHASTVRWGDASRSSYGLRSLWIPSTWPMEQFTGPMQSAVESGLADATRQSGPAPVSPLPDIALNPLSRPALYAFVLTRVKCQISTDIQRIALRPCHPFSVPLRAHGKWAQRSRRLHGLQCMLCSHAAASLSIAILMIQPTMASNRLGGQ